MIAHVLAGLTTKEAAREMGISSTTALTYRDRAFSIWVFAAIGN
ncbi:hypothetical protein [Caenimonas soli]|nr:hypothetical protein [Caenimonas soli]